MMVTIEQWIIKEYLAERSTYDICEELNKNPGCNWYPNKVNRLLKKAGVRLRDKAEAQSCNLRSGRTRHPTEGTTRSQETKLKISESVSNTYQSDPAAKVKRCKQSKEKYDNMTPAAKENLRSVAAKALRASVDEGSRIEKYVANELRQMGLALIMHSKQLVPNNSLHIDIFIPELNVCIEIDGLSHVQPVWGQEALERTQAADAIKNGLILNKYNLIRLEAFARKFTSAYARRTWDRLKPTIEMLQQKKIMLLPIEERFIYLKETESEGGEWSGL